LSGSPAYRFATAFSAAEEGFRKRLHASGKRLFASLGKTKRMIESLACIQFDPLGLATHADLNALFSMIPDRDLKEEALERTNGKDYAALRKRDKEIARMVDAIARRSPGGAISSVCVERDAAARHDHVHMGVLSGR
jgi:hypothetical protein